MTVASGIGMSILAIPMVLTSSVIIMAMRRMFGWRDTIEAT